MAKMSVMFSGSRGNCTYISSGKDAVLVDVGVSAKQILMALEQRMLEPSLIRGIFITHSHSDHISGLRVLLKKHNIPVYASEETLRCLIAEEVFNSKSKYYNIEASPELFMDMNVEFFRTSHDCEGSGGYVFTFLNGEKAAFNEIVARYKNLVYSVILRMITDGEEANDLAQEVFIKVYKNLNRYSSEFKLSTWIIRITTNHVIDYRRKKKQETVSIDELVYEPTDYQTPEKSYLQSEQRKGLAALVNGLPEMYKVPIVLYHQQ